MPFMIQKKNQYAMYNFSIEILFVNHLFKTPILYLFLCYRNPNSIEIHDHFLPISKEKNRLRMIKWEQYDPVHQKYLEISKFI